MIATERDLQWIVGIVLAREQPDAIYLFGSCSKDTQTDDSDIDLLLVAPSNLPRAHRGKQVTAALATFPKRFDVLCYTPEELTHELADPRSFASTIMTTARLLYRAADATAIASHDAVSPEAPEAGWVHAGPLGARVNAQALGVRRCQTVVDQCAGPWKAD